MASGIFQGAHDLVLDRPQFVEFNQVNQVFHDAAGVTRRFTLNALLNASMPAAFHDSSARYPPPRCHPSTRRDFIEQVTSWSLSTSSHPGRALWVSGPAGSGKSAIAQSCAEFLAQQGILGAAVFFSSSSGWNDPNRLFTSISYQLATNFAPYAEVLSNCMIHDPALVTKSIQEQFQGLLVRPLRQVDARKISLKQWVVIIDGLDECEGEDMQYDIVETIGMSAHTTPLRWVLISRAEPHIAAAFRVDNMASLSLHLKLPVSREVDHEFFHFLADELMTIRKKRGLPSSWPAQADIQVLVELSAGLFVYAATIVRFIGERNSSGPIDRLNAVLSLATGSKQADLDSPLAELDSFYSLIMQSIPSKVLLIVQKILLLKSLSNPEFLLPHISAVLGLSEAQFRYACGFLHSVLYLDDSSLELVFYHTSFMDFMKDQERSREFCVYLYLEQLWRDLLHRLDGVHSRSGDTICIDIMWPSPKIDERQAYRCLIVTFFYLWGLRGPLDPSTADLLLEFDFQMIPRLWKDPFLYDFELSPALLSENVPPGPYKKIIRLSRDPRLYLCKPENARLRDRPYILGHGRHKIVCWKFSIVDPGWLLVPYPSTLVFS